MLKITIEADDITISIADEDLGEDCTIDKIIPVFQYSLMAMGFHPNCVSDCFSDEYNLWLSNSEPE